MQCRFLLYRTHCFPFFCCPVFFGPSYLSRGKHLLLPPPLFPLPSHHRPPSLECRYSWLVPPSPFPLSVGRAPPLPLPLPYTHGTLGLDIQTSLFSFVLYLGEQSECYVQKDTLHSTCMHCTMTLFFVKARLIVSARKGRVPGPSSFFFPHTYE